MAKFVSAIREEIRRLARREAASATRTLQGSIGKYRREVEAMKQQLQNLLKKLNYLDTRERQRRVAVASAAATVPDATRFSPRSVRTHRKRLGLSARDYGRLLGVSGLTVFNWEHGKSRPRPAQLAALVAARKMGKREARARLELLNGKS